MQLRSSGYFILFCLLPGLGYQYVQDELRPHGGLDGAVAYLAGVAPNFLGGVSLTAGFILLAPYVLPGSQRLKVGIAALGSLVGLLGWEVLQIWMPGETFDPADLWWTVPGVAISVIAAFFLLQINRSQNEI
jgi:glycopeptide antibiotics resistance protein